MDDFLESSSASLVNDCFRRKASMHSIATSQVKDQEADDDLLCPICTNLIWEPVGCQTCKLHACLKCIQDWKSNPARVSCPISGCTLFIDEKPHPFFFKHLSSLKISCPNRSKGCEVVISYEKYDQHLSSMCDFLEISCPDPRCGEKYLKRDLALHQESCSYFEIACSYCQLVTTRQEQGEHFAYICAKYPLNCENSKCEKKIPRCEMRTHLKSCEFRVEICSVCSELYGISESNRHEANCAEKRKRCTGCKKRFRQFELADHEKTCESITLKCPLCMNEFPQHSFEEKHTEPICLRGIIASLQSENSALKRTNAELIEQQKVIEEKLEVVYATCTTAKGKPEEIDRLEGIVVEQQKIIMEIFEREKYLKHMEKKHNFKPPNAQEAIRHFQFLENTSYLYYGWHSFHCSDCMSCAVKIAPLIKPHLLKIREAEKTLDHQKFLRLY